MTGDHLFTILYYLLTYGIFLYSAVLVLSYLFIGLYSIGETRKYLYKNSFTDYRLLASSMHTPSVSVLAPAYNEGKTIVENVRSLLSIYYNNLELIVINDGSKDDCLQQLIEAYELEKIPFFVNYRIETKAVRGVYRSRNPVYSKLVVVDKENGGKADALNVGINLASNNYLVCIDVDCVLEQDAILKMIKPFLEQSDEKVIASGGVIRVANSCIIHNGRLIKVKMPDDYLPRMQALEYIRAFILGRMAWSRLNGLMLISGAFGAFDREIAIRCGGYNHNTVGEDMELVVRMRRYMEEQGIKYRVTYIPDPLCWTEVPSSLAILGRQRNRWTRGTVETLKLHRKMFFNPRYRLLGMISYPYWFFFEMLSPLIEFFGFICFLLFAIIGLIDWTFFAVYLLFIICFGYLYSAFAILMETLTYNQYRRRTDILRLLLTALTEPFYFHPFVVWSAIKGYWDLWKKKKSWGEMTRKGFGTKPAAPAAATTTPTTVPTSSNAIAPPAEEPEPYVEWWVRLVAGLYNSFKDFLRYTLILVLLLIAARAYELISDCFRHGAPPALLKTIGLAFLKDLGFFLQAALPAYTVFLLLYLVHRRVAAFFFSLFSVLILLIQLALSQYFLTTLVPLGGDLWAYSWADIRQTIGAAGGVPLPVILALAAIVALSSWLFIILPRKINPGAGYVFLALFLFMAAAGTGSAGSSSKWMPGPEYSNTLSINKLYYFYHASLLHFMPDRQEDDIYSDAYSGDTGPSAGGKAITQLVYPDEQHYPFYHLVDTSADVLSPFFNQAAHPPNLVILLVEGLGRAFTNEGAYLGNFTPFLDSLSHKSLYWENFLSSGGRTFAVLPSLLGSLPFAKNGFNELGDKMPPHLSLLSLLKQDGYRTAFYYGGDSRFDNMNLFLQRSAIGAIYDESTYPATYQKMPSTTGFTWGYGDKELFRHFFEVSKGPEPSLSILLTLSTHSPFQINEQEHYLQRFEQRMTELGFDEGMKNQARDYSHQYASILFMDDAIRDFFRTYAAREDFKNTVFLITGDHRMPEIPMSSKLDRYHVPLLIYSPLLKRTARFTSISTHFDITPSLLNWLHHAWRLPIPAGGSWIGTGLDTSRSFRNIHAYPLMQTKNDLIDFVRGEYMLNNTDLYRIGNQMQLLPLQDEGLTQSLQTAFDRFRQKNDKITQGMPLLPDSLYRDWFPK